MATVEIATSQDGDFIDELEVVETDGVETDLFRHHATCQKNPGHHDFIPIDKFTMNHLPPAYRVPELLESVQLLSDLTCRVTVRYVSEHRPSTFPGSNNVYLNYQNRGRRRMSVGTGWVDDVNVNTDRHANKICRCLACKTSPCPEREFVEVSIQTATHVVFDELEAAETSCHFFYDKGISPEACPGVVEVKGAAVLEKCVLKDRFRMTFYSHDMDFGSRLRVSFELLKHTLEIVRDIYRDKTSMDLVLSESDHHQELMNKLKNHMSQGRDRFNVNTTIIENILDQLDILTYRENSSEKMVQDSKLWVHILKKLGVQDADATDVLTKYKNWKAAMSQRSATQQDCPAQSSEWSYPLGWMGKFLQDLSSARDSLIDTVSDMVTKIGQDICFLSKNILKITEMKINRHRMPSGLTEKRIEELLADMTKTSITLSEKLREEMRMFIHFIEEEIKTFPLSHGTDCQSTLKCGPYVSVEMSKSKKQDESEMRKETMKTRSTVMSAIGDVMVKDLLTLPEVIVNDLKLWATTMKTDEQNLLQTLQEAQNIMTFSLHQVRDIMKMDRIAMRGILFLASTDSISHGKIISAIDQNISHPQTHPYRHTKVTEGLHASNDSVEAIILSQYGYLIKLLIVRKRAVTIMYTFRDMVIKEMVIMRSNLFEHLLAIIHLWTPPLPPANPDARDDPATDMDRAASLDITHSVGGGRLAVVVSHPHGCSKMVTVGGWVGSNQAPDPEYKLQAVKIFTTPTCPGSSGARVLTVEDTDWRFINVHNGHYKQLNYSSYGVATETFTTSVSGTDVAYDEETRRDYFIEESSDEDDQYLGDSDSEYGSDF